MKTLLKIFVIVCCYFVCIGAKANDFDTIRGRMFDLWLTLPEDENVEAVMAAMDERGAFEGLDYNSPTDDLRPHLKNLITLASAYKNPESSYFGKEKIKEAYLKSLAFWVNTDQRPANWWCRYIPYPQWLAKSVALMEKEVKEDGEFFRKLVEYFRFSYETGEVHMGGANGTDIILGSLLGSVMTENHEQMMEFKARMDGLLTIQPVNGINADYLFAQHCGSGRQLYMCNYGNAYAESSLYYIELCDGTEYQSEGGKELLQRLFIEGVQWIFFKSRYDPNNGGRFISSDAASQRVLAIADRLCRFDTPYKARMQEARNRIAGENSLEGNRVFWRFDYMIHRRDNYFASSRMVSKRTVGNEEGGGNGVKNYYSGNGVNYVSVTGKEYDRDYFSRFNCYQFPGITAEQDYDFLPIPTWGSGGSNGSAYAGGATDGNCGVCGMILDRNGVRACKSWFYFDNEYICLGADIECEKGENPVYTTVNQTNRDGRIRQGRQNGKDWLLHGRIGYVNLMSDSGWLVSADNGLFSLNIDHGVRPEKAGYAYMVIPDADNCRMLEKACRKLPVSILENNGRLQAVRHNGQGVVEAMFYEAGKLEVKNDVILEADAPCAVLWNEKENTMSVADPLGELSRAKAVNITVKVQGKTRKLHFDLPDKEYAGMSVSKKIN